MRIRIYLKERWLQLLMLLVTVTLVVLFGRLIGIPTEYLVLVWCSFMGIWFLVWCTDFLRKKQFYRFVEEQLEALDKKYLLPELLDCPEFSEGRFFYETLQEMTKSMSEYIGKFRNNSEEYKEYIEMWVHEIKLPIATGKMVLENHKGEYSDSLSEELDKIDGYAEQALFYARSNYVEKDYLLTRTRLEDVAREVIRENKKGILREKIRVNLHDLETEVYSDRKWLAFILKQILSNSLKYMGDGEKNIEWYAVCEKERVCLYLRDSGMGIPVQDTGRVFEKGFTGENGRAGKKSTGMGLYLCRKLCEKMGHRIWVNSSEGKGCEVIIVFPKGSMTESVR